MPQKYLLRTEVAGKWNFSVFVDDLLVRVELGDHVAAVVALVTLHRLGFQIACSREKEKRPGMDALDEHQTGECICE